MYTDKINPDHPEGRLLISPDGFYLKDPSLPTSDVPLCDKAEKMFKHLEKNNFEVRAKERMRKYPDPHRGFVPRIFLHTESRCGAEISFGGSVCSIELKFPPISSHA